MIWLDLILFEEWVRKVENNNITVLGLLTEDVNDVRQIVQYYNEWTVDINTKDTELLRQLAKGYKIRLYWKE